MSSENSWLEDVTINTTLMFHLQIIDDYTGNTPIEKIKIHPQNENNLEIFSKANDQILLIKQQFGKKNSDFDESIFDALSLKSVYYQKKVEIDSIQKIENQQTTKYFLLKGHLFPKVNYPFPADATLIRGFVKFRKNPLKKPKIMIQLEQDHTVWNIASSDGEFVLYFKRSKNWQVEPTTNLINIGADTNFRLIINCDGYVPENNLSFKIKSNQSLMLDDIILEGEI